MDKLPRHSTGAQPPSGAPRGHRPRRPVAGWAGLAAALLAGVLLEACADDTPTGPGAAEASAAAAMGASQDGARIVIEPHWVTLDTVGVTDTLTATVLNAAGDTLQAAQVAWTSADTAIAEVDGTGVVTAIAFGSTRVTATYGSASAEATVEVAPPLSPREVLEIFYEATGGDGWTNNTNWLSDKDIKEWHGVGMGYGGPNFLYLPSNNLVGRIPPELGRLPELFNITLYDNDLTGAIPAALSQLPVLRDLFLSENRGLGGRLPPELGHMDRLQYLLVDGTDLSGPVPLTFANLQLKRFYFDRDGVCIPAELEAWVQTIPEKEEYYELCKAELTLDAESLYFEDLGDTTRLAAAVINALGDTVHDAAVTWLSLNAEIASVDSTGLVTAVDHGTTRIRATHDSLFASAGVEVVLTLSDREVLDSIFRITGGANWTDTTGWLSDQPLSEWAGVRTNAAGKVVDLSLGNNNLTGRMPALLGELGYLVTLDMSGNALGGGIPAGLHRLKRLRNLVLNGNALTGVLPPELGSLPALRYLHIGANTLGGVVPRSYANLALDTLYAERAGVCVPPSLGEWYSGIERTDSAAHCVPSIAIAVDDLASLTFYAVGETASLSAAHVTAEGDTTHAVQATWASRDTAVVSVGAATGRVTAVGTGRTKVVATYDSTSGEIAVEVDIPDTDRDALEVLYDRTRGGGWTEATNWLSDEPLSAWAGVETDDSGRVVGLSLRGNNLRGPIHTSIGQLDRLTTLDLGHNWLSGTIPGEIGDLVRLRELVLSVNGFVGALPAELGSLDSLRTLNVAATSVSGPVPASFADLRLETILVNGTGVCVPPSLAAWWDAIAETSNAPVCATRVSVNPPSLTFSAAGDTARLAVTVIGPEGNRVRSPAVVWASSDTTVATVDAGGLVTARAIGATGVTATYDSATAKPTDVAVALPGSDRTVLEMLYRAMGGEDWTNNRNWLTTASLDDWYGVDTDRDGRVANLWLPDNNLTGRIPAAVGLLDALFSLDLRGNALAGPIPPTVGRLRGLRDLSLSTTEVSGPVPPEIGDMTNLSYLSLSDTDLSGPIPETLANLDLAYFYVGGAEVCLPRSLSAWYDAREETSGELLPCIPETADRDVLVALYNKTGGPGWYRQEAWLSGKSINRWAGIDADAEGYVTEISLTWNRLTNSIPPELGDLGRLETLSLGGNRLTGRIPPELGKLSKLRKLALWENALEGPLPPELGRLVSASVIELSGNHLSGPIPAEFGNLAALETLELYYNRLNGRLPPELGKLQNLRFLALSDNEITGSLPAEFGGMTALEDFAAARNKLSGALPPQLGKLRSLKYLVLDTNQLSGPIPPEMGDLESLEELFLARNRLSGSIPPELGNLSNLNLLWLFENQLTGSIPAELGNLAQVTRIAIGDNPLTGRIPPELGRLSTLEDLHIGRARLSGPIPPELGKLTSLVYLGLFSNQLSGPVPPEFGQLKTLETLHLSYNRRLSGLLPRTLMDLEFFANIAIKETGLCPHLDDTFRDWLDALLDVDFDECDARDVERYALSALHGATGGGTWTNRAGWNAGTRVGNWYGVTVSPRDSLVRRLDLADNGLAGPLPPEIANLREMETLDLADNDLSGGFPIEITTLDALDTIRVSGNADMKGALPFRMIDLTNLKALQYGGTGLCASPSASFQSWIDGLAVSEGATCDNPDSVRVSLPVVYLTQAIQRKTGDVPLISGREALLRVFLVGDRGDAFFEPEVVATLTRGGREVHRTVMRSVDDRLSTFADEGNLRASYNAVIPAQHVVAGTELTIVADSAGTVPLSAGSRTRFPETGAMALDVIEVPPLELTVVPVLYHAKPDSSIFDWTATIGDDSPQVGLLKYAFPFGEFSAKTREPYVTSLDLTEEDNTWPLVLELEKAYRAEGATGYWYGVADSQDGYVRGVARLNGWVSFGKPWDTELAHEVGHSLDLLHAPCGGALGTDPDFPYSNGSTGVWGYDFRDGSTVSPHRRRDIMGYCYEKGWLSDYYFEKVIRLRAEKEGAAARRRMMAAGRRGRMLVLWGGVLDGELRIEPVHSMVASPELPEEPGPYRIEGFARGGATEFSLSFTPGEDKYGNKYFFFTIPIEEDWEGSLERITLTGPEGEVTVDTGDQRSITVVSDPATGRIRAILRDWTGPLPAALGRGDGLAVETTRGVLDAVRRR